MFNVFMLYVFNLKRLKKYKKRGMSRLYSLRMNILELLYNMYVYINYVVLRHLRINKFYSNNVLLPIV